jgi:hypothetical protein
MNTPVMVTMLPALIVDLLAVKEVIDGGAIATTVAFPVAIKPVALVTVQERIQEPAELGAV